MKRKCQVKRGSCCSHTYCHHSINPRKPRNLHDSAVRTWLVTIKPPKIPILWKIQKFPWQEEVLHRRKRTFRRQGSGRSANPLQKITKRPSQQNYSMNNLHIITPTSLWGPKRKLHLNMEKSCLLLQRLPIHHHHREALHNKHLVNSVTSPYSNMSK